MRWSSRLGLARVRSPWGFSLLGMVSAVSLLWAAPPQATPAPKVRVLIDAAHGGRERGATLPGNLAEKDLALELARKLRLELEKRGVAATLLREDDQQLSADQRAAAINAGQPELYVALHAATLGSGLRLYTSLLPPADPAPGAFLPWKTAQAAYVERSRAAAEKMAVELETAQLPYELLRGAVLPLDRVAAPAVAIEFAFTRDLRDPAHQQRLASALAAGIAQVRSTQGAQ